MLEKGFWFSQPADKVMLEKAQGILKEASIAYHLPITASVLESEDNQDFLRLIDVVTAKGLIPDEYARKIVTSPVSCTQIVFRDTYERVNPNSFLTREDMLVIIVENACIPIKLSLAYLFIELKEPAQFEMANTLLYGMPVIQPKPLPLKKRDSTDEAKSIRYLSKQEVFSLSREAKRRNALQTDTIWKESRAS